jgi:hypothetical protein
MGCRLILPSPLLSFLGSTNTRSVWYKLKACECTRFSIDEPMLAEIIRFTMVYKLPQPQFMSKYLLTKYLEYTTCLVTLIPASHEAQSAASTARYNNFMTSYPTFLALHSLYRGTVRKVVFIRDCGRHSHSC